LIVQGRDATTWDQKKAGVVEHPRVFNHAGLLSNELPGTAGQPFI